MAMANVAILISTLQRTTPHLLQYGSSQKKPAVSDAAELYGNAFFSL